MMYLRELSGIPVSGLSTVTKRQKGLLARLGLKSVYDVLMYFPFRYEDRSRVESVADGLKENRPVTVLARVIDHQSFFFNRRNHPKIVIEAGDYRAILVGFNRPYLVNSLKIGHTYWVNALFHYKYNEIQAAAFDFEEYEEGKEPKHFGRVLPVYSLTEEVYQKELRTIVEKVLTEYLGTIDDELPDYLLSARKLISKKEAVSGIHRPATIDEMKKAKLRLAYEELLSIQLVVRMKREFQREQPKERLYPREELMRSFLADLGFQLTQGQESAIADILKDFRAPHSMHRLLQGDVGSGKTVVAFAAMICAAENGLQSALMVPTESLAIQHYRKLSALCPAGPTPPALLTGSTPPEERSAILEGLENGSISLVIGTHALLQPEVTFRNLGFIVFDEQHKFGVEQRIALARKAENPDILVMTATPIPRTLTLTLYGDLEVSVIASLPGGRIPIKTKWVKREHDTDEAYRKLLSFAETQLSKGFQVYVVTPLIDGQESGRKDDLKRMAEFLKTRFKQFRVGVLHGRMSPDEKQKVFEEFQKGEIQILAATTVIEVGIDVPNATLIIIEGADRFGLSQLHQLRGRVGRGGNASFCALITPTDVSEDTVQRMEIMVETQDGFRIAEEDLRQRGPGEILGIEQSGLPELKVAEVFRDEKLLLTARSDAETIVRSDIRLTRPQHEGLSSGVVKWLPASYLVSG